MAVKVKVTGDKAVQRILTQLPARMLRKVLRATAAAAGAPVVKGFKRLAPKQYGWLRKSIDKKVKTYTQSNTVVCIVGPKTQTTGTVTRNGKAYVVKPYKYAHLVDAGTKPHSITMNISLPNGGKKTITVQHPGSAAQNFKQRTFTTTEGQALAIYKSKMAEGAIREAKSLGGK